MWLVGTLPLAAAARGVWPVSAKLFAGHGSLASLPLDVALADLAATALLGCLCWAWLGLTATVAEAALVRGAPSEPARTHPPAAGAEAPRARAVSPQGTGSRRRTRPRLLPGPLRRLVLACCGVALASGLAQPAWATPHAVPDGHHRLSHQARGQLRMLDGLPLPERVVSPGPMRAKASPADPTVTVRRGDCLWSIAVDDLPPGASPAAVVARWQAIYAANIAVIGPDPDALEPGQRLVLPAARPPRSARPLPSPRRPR